MYQPILWVNYITGGKTLVFINVLDSWRWVNLNEKYVSITDLCIKPHNFNSQLKSHIKHCFLVDVIYYMVEPG
jgi:hypothetical protein